MDMKPDKPLPSRAGCVAIRSWLENLTTNGYDSPNFTDFAVRPKAIERRTAGPDYSRSEENLLQCVIEG